MHPLLVPIARLWGRYELPKWRSVLWRVSGWGWIDGLPTREITGKVHGYRLSLNLCDWSDRFAYFLGRYYEDHTQMLMLKGLRPGDRFIDIGANIGWVSLLAAWCVGDEGEVHSFEPNPRVMQRLKGHIGANGLSSRITTYPLGLADERGEFTLRLPGRHTGQATMAPLDDADGGGEEFRVEVRVGDGVFAGLTPDRPTFIKIDVEGFECRVLDGLKETIRRLGPAVMTEVTPVPLSRAGVTPSDVFARMHALGFRGYSVEYVPGLAGFTGRMVVRPLPAFREGAPNEDVLWLLPGSVHEERLKPFMTG